MMPTRSCAMSVLCERRNGPAQRYAPNMFATVEELAELAKVAAKYGGIYTSHIRGERSSGIAAIREAIDISQKGRPPSSHSALQNVRKGKLGAYGGPSLG